MNARHRRRTGRRVSSSTGPRVVRLSLRRTGRPPTAARPSIANQPSIVGRFSSPARLGRRLGRLAGVAGLIGLAAGGGAAAALLTAGHGTGNATVAGDVTLVASATVDGALAPDTRLPVTVRVTNGNAHAIVVQSLSGDGTAAVSDAGDGGCDPSAVAFSAAPLAPSDPRATLGPGQARDFVGVATMSPTATAGCQGARFGLPVLVTARLG